MTERERSRGDHVDLESAPLTRPEYIAALVHFYRGELARANVWRMRLDTTTNWAILCTVGLLSFAFSEASHTHVSLLLGHLLILLFLTNEARRFRLFDVWRSRARMIEENFFGPLLRRDLQSPRAAWGTLVADDLLRPRFKITFWQAFRARLMRNYLPVLVILNAAWWVKVVIHPRSAVSIEDLLANIQTGIVPWWVYVAVATGSMVFLGLVIALVDIHPNTDSEAPAWVAEPDAQGRPVEPLDL